MPSKVANHLHRYQKKNLSVEGEYFVYRCTKPACSHYISIRLAEGKLCECNRCGEPMVITKAVLNGSSGKPMAKPHCPSCTESKKIRKEDVAAIDAFLSGTKDG